MTNLRLLKALYGVRKQPGLLCILLIMLNSSLLNKQLLKKQLTLFATINNPAVKYRLTRTVVSSAGFDQRISDQNLYRGASIALSYRFGRLKEQMKKPRKKIENTDVSNDNRKIE